ncbi:hypothetical protein ACP6D1_12010, partial [Klebsiella pneumoniae subsp. pneumoniae]|uniref:hypothetical protein n=1 Tax=Klebsiella pneumoniae TaxID=573 RepID=UPI003CF4C4C3
CVTEWRSPVTGFHINPGCGLFLPGIRQQILSERAYLRTGAHNVYYVKSTIEGIYTTYRIHSSVSLLFT